MIVREYLASKALKINIAPLNTPSSKLKNVSNSGMKVLPPLKASSSLERASVGPIYS